MKRLIITAFLIVTALSVISVFAVRNHIHAYDQKLIIESFQAGPFYTGGVPEIINGHELSSRYPSLYPVTDEGEYIYWMNQDALIEMITLKEDFEVLEEEQLTYNKQDVAEDAVSLFRKVFSAEIAQLGEDIHTDVTDFSGGDYTATCTLKYKGLDSGNMAGLSFSADGRLLTAVFLPGGLSAEEIEREPAVDSASAIELARNEALREITASYGEETADNGTLSVHGCRLRIFRGAKFFEVLLDFSADPAENGAAVEESFSIRIDADSGKCLENASTLH